MIRRIHAHFTVECTANELNELAKIVKGKATTIDLYKDKHHQIDRMLTVYYNKNLDVKEYVNFTKQQIQYVGYKVNRVKIEAEYNSSISSNMLNDGKYIESHIKVKNENLDEITGFALSKNPSEKGTKFYNKRMYNDNDINDYLIKLEHIKSKYNVIKVQEEVVLEDNNFQLDSWWA